MLAPTITPTPTTTVNSVTITFAQNLSGVNGNSVPIPSGYNSITFNVIPSSSFGAWAPQVSFDGGNTWFEQHRFYCNGTVCPQVIIPILGPHYRFGPGSSVSVSVTGTLNPEPNAKVILLGQNVNYPFTSQTFNTNGFSTITVSAGGGNNPQHVTGISIQRLENGSFVEKQNIPCDGGATCQFQTVSVLGGDYRVVLQGSGSGALLGAILR